MRKSHSADILPRLIYLTAIRLQFHADKVLQPFGITLEQLHPLKILKHGGGAIGQRQMCSLTGKTPANMTRILDRLVNKNLIERKPNPGDRRAFNIVLTSAGEKLVDQAVDHIDSYREQVMTGIADQDEAVCRRVLQRIAENLAGLAPEEIQRDDQD